MQKYILGASPDKQTAMIRPFDETGTTGDWQDYNAGIVYLAREVDARIAELEEVAGMALGALNSGVPISPRSVIHDELKSLMER